PDYWYHDGQIAVNAATPSTVDWELVRKCFGTMRGGVVRQAVSGAPIANAEVFLIVGDKSFKRTTDELGRYSFDQRVPLGLDNVPVTYDVRAPPPVGSPSGSQPGSAQVHFERCGD